MKLLLSPQLSERTATYARQDDTLLINGDPIDLSGDWAVLEPDGEGESLHPSGLLFAGKREGGQIVLTVLAPHGSGAPESARFPEPITLANGQSVTFPEVGDA